MTVQQFQRQILDFYRKNGRRDLPWRRTHDPYAILVSEIVMQQTQVTRGIERFPRFMKRFPTVEALARASQKSVLKEWLGLGYNRRALNIHRAAKMIVADYAGKVPPDPEALMKLPGVGLYTANAVAAFAFNQPVVVLDTNIRRVFIHHFFSKQQKQENKKILSLRGFARPASPGGGPLRRIEASQGGQSHFARQNEIATLPSVARDDIAGKKITDKDLIPLIQKTIYHKNPRLWYSALMDYGALGSFGQNPNRTSAHYVKQSRFEGSHRFFRAKLVSFILNHSRGVTSLAVTSYAHSLPDAGTRDVASVLKELQREGFVIYSNGLWRISR